MNTIMLISDALTAITDANGTSLLPFHCTSNIALAPAIKFFVSCIKVLQSCDAVIDIHCIASAAFMATMPPKQLI